MAATAPLNITVAVPVRLVPVKVTGVPTGPLVVEILEREGSLLTVNGTALLLLPPAMRYRFPVVAVEGTRIVIEPADQEVTSAMPLPTTTYPLPWVAPKLLPVMVTNAAGAPKLGLAPLIVGAAAGKLMV